MELENRHVGYILNILFAVWALSACVVLPPLLRNRAMVLDGKRSRKRKRFSDYDTQYLQFKNKPHEAILFLLNKKEGVAIDALYHPEVGYIDIVWGDETYGLEHIVTKHGKEFAQMLANLPNIIEELDLVEVNKDKILLQSEYYKVLIVTNFQDNKRNWLLSAYDITLKENEKWKLGSWTAIDKSNIISSPIPFKEQGTYANSRFRCKDNKHHTKKTTGPCLTT
ncbi:MAG: hypothetical protein SNJ77_12070 [Cytophagales bacterium]